ncbi:alanine racemase [Novosphingobium sp.]|uniref:alanine racemase n=1 Tax=Novosphingobium sp. TaxID=1874826 RepID=UPI0038B9F11C
MVTMPETVSFVELPPSPLRLTLDTHALAANWRVLNAASGAARAGAAVKADAYGLGAAAVVPVLAEAGCRDWFVAHWQEVPTVLAHAPPADLAVLHGPLTDADVAFARATGVRPVLNSLDQVRRWLAGGGGRCDLMVDTGINRLGLPLADLGDPLLRGLDIDCCHSHLASADEDVPQNAVQLARFAEVRVTVPARRFALANSAGISLGADYHFDLTRPGLALYGGIARPEQAAMIRQVARPQAAIIQLRELQPGDRVGYNATFTASAAMRAAIVALGYADGYLRCWSGGKGALIWKGQQLPVLGRISMDMTIVDASNAYDLKEGDWLDVAYDPVAAARSSGLSQYELFTLLGRRFDR